MGTLVAVQSQVIPLQGAEKLNYLQAEISGSLLFSETYLVHRGRPCDDHGGGVLNSLPQQ